MEKKKEVSNMGQYMKEGDPVIPNSVIVAENIRKGNRPVVIYIQEITTRPPSEEGTPAKDEVVAAILQKHAPVRTARFEKDVVSRGGEEFTFGYRFRAFGAAVQGVVDFARDMIVPLEGEPENGIPGTKLVGVPLARYLAPIGVPVDRGPIR